MSTTPKIRITNTLTNRKEIFEPIQAGNVSIYACGVTVYDLCHLGHAMQAIIYDTIVRYLRHRNFQVNYVRNYTDVDDKIIDRANERGMFPLELSNEMIKACDDDLAAVGVQPANSQPKVSDYIPEIISYIQTLIEKGYAYATENGDVYYEVRKKSDYGKLSNQKIEQLRSGQRILNDDENVKMTLDFALWKSSDVEGFVGSRLGALEDLDGTLNVQLCHPNYSGIILIFMEEDVISFFLIMKTRLPNRKPTVIQNVIMQITGCTQDC